MKEYALTINEKDCTALFRSLLEYDKILRLSAIRDSVLVSAELYRVRDLQERLSLIHWYPIEEDAA
jgi:hypothetical protein